VYIIPKETNILQIQIKKKENGKILKLQFHYDMITDAE
jgi:hypothetical protein